MGLAFAATAGRPTTLVNGAVATAGPARADPAAAARAIHDMVRAGLDRHAFSATAALVWSGDLPPAAGADPVPDRGRNHPELAAIGLLAVAVGLAPKVQH
jgi:hypothetical protein